MDMFELRAMQDAGAPRTLVEYFKQGYEAQIANSNANSKSGDLTQVPTYEGFLHHMKESLINNPAVSTFYPAAGIGIRFANSDVAVLIGDPGAMQTGDIVQTVTVPIATGMGRPGDTEMQGLPPQNPKW